MDDASAYYLLTYRSTHVDDGKFREVQVHVKRPNVSVRARKGYWALWPDEAFVAELLARGNAPAPSKLPPAFDVPRRTSPLIRPWFGTSRGDDGKIRVTFVWEPVARVPGDRSRVGPPARVELKALGPDGALVFDGTVMPATGSELQSRADPAAARAIFDVAPGRVRLVMAIEDAGAQPIDSDAREIRSAICRALSRWAPRKSCASALRATFARSTPIPTPCRSPRASSAAPSV